MKKIIISLAAASVLLFTGCLIDSDTATVRINLGNIPVAKVEKKSLIDRFLMIFAKEAVAQEVPYGIEVQVVHLGAFDSNNQLLAKKSINVTQGEPTPAAPPPTIVEFDVPARSGVTIVVLGEFTPIVAPGPPVITYYGKNETPLNLTAGATESISIVMDPLERELLNLVYDYEPYSISWDNIVGSSAYKMYDPDYEFVNSSKINKTTDTSIRFMKIEFNFTGRDSEYIPIEEG